jgi:hypothetical protein
MTYYTFEQRLENVARHAWETVTGNGHNMDTEERGEWMKSCNDAATNEWMDGISDDDWLNATLAKTGHHGA